MSAGQAVKLGYKNVRVYLAGEPEWSKKEQAVYAGYGYICQGNNVIIDLRPPEKAKKGHLPRAVSMPIATLEDTFDEVPAKAPIILYSDNQEDTMQALRVFKENGYKKIALIHGGYHGWKRLGGKLVEGPITTEVNWTRKLAPGEVSMEDFLAAVEDPSKALILDVRTNEEVKTGKIPTSKHIPLDELCSKMDEFFASLGDITKDQMIYIHCTTGARAEMAFKELSKNGYKNAKFLFAQVSCEEDDCDIEE